MEQIHISEAARPSAPSYSASRGRSGATAGPLGWLAVAAAAAGLLWLFFGKAISSAMLQWGRGGKKGGKWVSDRSLGGRMVGRLTPVALAILMYTDRNAIEQQHVYWAGLSTCVDVPIVWLYCLAKGKDRTIVAAGSCWY